MGISRGHDKKSPTDRPESYFKMEAPGTVYGTPRRVPDMSASGPMREQLMGNPALSRRQDPSASTRKGRTGGSQGEGHGKHPVGPEMAAGAGKSRQ